MRRPSTALMMMGVVSRYATCTQMNTRLSSAGNDEPDRAYELQQPQGHPGAPRQRAEGTHIMAYLIKHEDLHDAGRSVQERGDDLQDPQQDVHFFIPVLRSRILQRLSQASGSRHVLLPIRPGGRRASASGRKP